ncbi:FAD-binding and (Fe-S)-binding domain-containing protein [Haloarcula salina]|uniref:D-lactate dehydrogenase (cytochrome) n=1 Tax=Haloarcula salina TaxID=1429914 RepID=A0AA41KJQ8_9EURY|nr:FAD-binding and (Fe-S)-binding domain-containing protein [Haloarcula salina]MBV0903023.1 FAD-binding protein [Haloarcula salina]
MSGQDTPAQTDATPAADPRADYDHVDSGDADSALASALADRVDGDVRFDAYSRELYATDASIYEVPPIGVVFPASTADVAAVVSHCAEHDVPVLPRGGGTSLAGQTVNEAVVLDFTRHMDALGSVDADARRATAQVGTTLGELNAALAPHDLKFAPDPAWGEKSALGGAIGNNTTGAHSLQYGKTDHYIEACEVVLADGTVTTFGEVAVDDLRDRATDADGLEGGIYAAVADVLDDHRDEIAAAYPDLKRNVSGYNLDRLVAEAQGEYGESGTVNLASLLAGSEGTLAVATEATVALEPVPETKAMALLCYDDLVDAMADVAPILEHDPAAVEVLDDTMLDLARDTAEFADVAAMLPDGTRATLIVEFYAEHDDAGHESVDRLLADRLAGSGAVTDAPRTAVDALEAHGEADRERFWKLRKSGLPILLSRTTDAKHVAFIEDTAVPPENLPEYVADFQRVLDDHDTFASFYAHAGPGVLHIRPLVDTKSVDGVEQMVSIADAVTDLVVEYGGSVSGEHGDGRARTCWNEKLYGTDVWDVFRRLKTAFDPDWLLNPGQVVGVDESAVEAGEAPPRAETVDMAARLRFSPDYEFDQSLTPTLDWDTENGMQGMVELCHGCGGCRGPQETTGGVMCPTYRAADEEITATRGRANMLRQAMSGDLPEDPTDEAFVAEVLDLCIGCKGCAHDCPSGVDMAKLKAEVTHAYHQEHGVSLRDRVFANVDTLFALGSRIAPVANALSSLPGADRLLGATVGIARERDTPTLHRETFVDWFERRGTTVPAVDAERSAVLFPDAYTNYAHLDVGKAAVAVLEAADVHVTVLGDHTDSGRPAYSKGMLDHARATAETNVDALADHVRDGRDVVFVEPSDAVMVQYDYPDLLGHDDEQTATVAANTYGFCEYLDRHDLDRRIDWTDADRSLTYHGHCHQKATKKDHHAVGVLRRAGYAVDPLDSGCCGMAGSFGYEAEHYSMSRAIGDILFQQVDDSAGDQVVAPGTSCRTQLGDRGERPEPPHPAETLAEALPANRP